MEIKSIAQLPLIFILFYSNLFAQEQTKETAWDADNRAITNETKYVYGYATVPPDFLSKMHPNDGNLDDDPFATKSHKHFNFYKTCPKITNKALPLCLPQHLQYQEVSELFRQNGVSIKAPQWSALSTGLTSNNKLYFCTTWHNADIIEQILTPLCSRVPRNVMTLTTLISISHEQFTNNEWTWKKLKKLKPRIHARYGQITRNGEKTHIKIKTPDISGESELELTLGENHNIYDCRLYFSCNIPETKTNINQLTAFTGNINNPFIINCGTKGSEHRQYLLVIQQTLMPPPPLTYEYKILAHLEKIEGIYEMRKNNTPPIKNKITKEKPTTVTYPCPSTLLYSLQASLTSNEPPPLRIYKNVNFTYPKNEKIYDISAALNSIGVNLSQNEYIHYNSTKNKVSIHSATPKQLPIIKAINDILPEIHVINFRADLYSVKKTDLLKTDWTLKKIQQSAPKHLQSYATVARSGEKSTFGYIIRKYASDPKRPKAITSDYAFEIEPSLSETNKYIHLHLKAETLPLGKDNFTFNLESTFMIYDGKPLIVEVGHPSSGEETHLLVLQADIIRTDGSFYRNRFKPIKP